MKKKWPYRRRSICDEIRLKISEWLIRFACSRPERKSGSLAWLQMWGKEQQPKEYDTTGKPEDLEFGLFEVAYFDLIFAEDFAKLKSGLNSLLDSYGGRLSPSKKKDLNDFFHSLSSEYSSGSWYNIGSLDFASARNSLKYNRYFETVHLQLLQFIPSAVILIISVTPTRTVKDRILNLVSTDAKERQIITRFLFRRGIIGSETLPPGIVRGKELEDILVELKEKIIQLLKGSIPGVFLSSYPPLPSIEVYEFEGGTRGVTDQTIQENGGTQPSDVSLKERNFWGAMNMFLDDPFTYKRDWFILYLPQNMRGIKQLDKPYRALIDKRLFQQVESLDGHGDLEAAMAFKLSFLFTGLSAPLVIRGFFEKTADEVASIRQYMVPPLTKAGKGWKNPFEISMLFKRKHKLDSQSFSCERIINELKKEDLTYLSHKYGIQDLLRKNEAEKDSVAFIDDIAWNIEYESKQITTQMKLLRNYYQDLINYKSLKVNLALQRVLLIFTVLLVFLALPENIQTQIYNFLHKIVEFFGGFGT